MPQPPTANMLLIKPVENGDSGIWASLLDAMFDVIDAHDHSPGKGIQLNQSRTKIDADIPWSSGGSFFAIKDLKAIDFQPQPQSAMAAFAGALFVDSANSELSYRTTGGAIVQFTNGATFNFAAIGAIGGDYSAIGALVDYVDANDLYRFRQQIGAGVRQYARVDCGGVDLFPYLAHPAGVVPGNRVRHQAPAALAAAYDITWPLGPPASTQYMAMDAAGNVIPGAPRTLSIHGSAFQVNSSLTWAYATASGLNTLGVSSFAIAPILLPVGARILAIRFYILDSVTGPTKVSGSLLSLTSAKALNVLGTTGASSGAGTTQTLPLGPLSTTMVTGTGYALEVGVTTGSSNWEVVLAEIDYDGV